MANASQCAHRGCNLLKNTAGLVSLLFAASGAVWAASALGERTFAGENDRPLLRVVYFVPTDREPEPDYRERLDRVMTEVQTFYRQGMKENGYGPMTFELDRDADGRLNIYHVQAKGSMAEYGRNDAGKVRREVKDSLARQGIDVDRETIVIFQLLLKWEGDKAIEMGPYVGGGGPRSGTAWVYDDRRLDARLLGSREPGGFYNGPCSLGRFNTHYIGGVAHELGHAFGLPHDCERSSERAGRGRSLMGSGNHTYGQERRGEGKGTFLSAASALPLSVHPLFTGKRAAALPAKFTMADFEVSEAIGSLTVKGRLEGASAAVGIVAHNDPQSKSGDYDAVGWTAAPRNDGSFELTIGELTPDEYRLRLKAYVASGDSSAFFTTTYRVDASGRPDVRPLREAVWLAKASDAFRGRDKNGLERMAADLRSRFPDDTSLHRKVEHVRSLFSPLQPKLLSAIDPTATEANLAETEFASATVGWGSPLRNHVLPESGLPCLIHVGGEFFESGLYAHAPASHRFRLDGQWAVFRTKFGLQDGKNGSVVFVVKGDGNELFRSVKVDDHQVRTAEMKIAGVQELELVVEDAGDGNASDWGVWIAPTLRRTAESKAR